MAGVRAVGAAGRGQGSLFAGSAGRRLRVRVGIGCSPPAVRGDPVARGVRGRSLSPHPAALILGAVGARCPSAVGTGVRVWGPALSLWPVCLVRGVWCQALSLPRLSVLRGGQSGLRGLCVPGAVGAGVRAQHQPHSERPCWPALRAVGVAEGRPRRGVLHRREGRLRSGASPPPTARPPAGLLGSATHVL